MTKITNHEGYAYFEGKPNNRPRLKLEVTFILNMVPGRYHQPEDLMREIARNPYVDTVTLMEAPLEHFGLKAPDLTQEYEA